MIGYIEPNPEVDIHGKKVMPGTRVMFIETWNNSLHYGTAERYSQERLVINGDNLNWKRLIMRRNVSKMVIVLGDKDKVK